jgi:LmbE family N-acetylglucosaminyl deacetylase
LDLLPPLEQRDPARLDRCKEVLAEVIAEFRPTAIIVPMFEGGHVHHDLANHAVTSLIRASSDIRVYEAPEYGPYVSLTRTPHRIVSLCTRWLFGLVAYYGPPDGIDDRPIEVVRLSTEELATRRRMLRAFKSQNIEALGRAHGYPDRLVVWRAGTYRARPFDVERSYLAFVDSLSRLAPRGVVRPLFPVQAGTIGREPKVTDLDAELGAA